MVDFVDHFREYIDDDLVILRKVEFDFLADRTAHVVRPQSLLNSKGHDTHVALTVEQYEDFVGEGLSDAIFYIRMPKKRVRAMGRFSCDPSSPWILVFRGSTLGPEVKSLEKKYVDERADLIARQIIASDAGVLRFTKHHSFDNAGRAARVIQGCPVSANEAWRDRDGKTLPERGFDV
jgi:hypothetical protein